MNWIQDFLATPVLHEPGSAFFYNSTGSTLLAAMVTRRAGVSLQEYLKTRLFDPIGIDADNLRWGVYAVFEGETDYARRCFTEYGVATDPSGRYAALWRPYHFIGLELGVSVASAALRREPTGAGRDWRGDVVAVAKRPLTAGEVLDGEGGACVWGKCVPASRSRALDALPIGLAHGVPLVRDVPEGAILTAADAPPAAGSEAARVRAEMVASHT